MKTKETLTVMTPAARSLLSKSAFCRL